MTVGKSLLLSITVLLVIGSMSARSKSKEIITPTPAEAVRTK